ncbi:hypothetical protein FQA47_016672 [Oryzias melastigma]|uniref:Uncharacterized protein n=1 Tax=Oryzias melastigma TaxID=30732 RepID=A0A834BWL6_ORYME|nr:hypothetical protein FQA47_016672 [Oryzias melastigma]
MASGALTATESLGEALDTQSRESSSAPPLELAHGAAAEFLADLCWDCASVTGGELATDEHGRGSGGGDREEFPALPVD